MGNDKFSGVPISHQMSTLYFPSDDAHAVATDLKAGGRNSLKNTQ